MLYAWGISLIKAIQTIQSPALTALIKGLTLLGDGLFYVPILLWLFWCIDEKRGIRCLFLFLLSTALNLFLKDLLKQPRPFTLDPTLGLAFEPSYGLPSGHAQASFTAWGFWASRLCPPRRRVRGWAAAAAAVLVVAFTRLYLGLHFPTDLFGGWCLGLIALLLYGLVEPWVSRLMAWGGTRARAMSAALLALLLNRLGIDLMLTGFLLGLGVAYGRTPFTAPARPLLLIGRWAIGAVGVGAVLMLGRWVGAYVPLPYTRLGAFLLTGLAGAWVGFGAPWCFARLGPR
jgi:membrane-associated phospholipid phosphatase